MNLFDYQKSVRKKKTEEEAQLRLQRQAEIARKKQEQQIERKRRLDAAMNRIEKKYGSGMIKKGSDLY